MVLRRCIGTRPPVEPQTISLLILRIPHYDEMPLSGDGAPEALPVGAQRSLLTPTAGRITPAGRYSHESAPDSDITLAEGGNEKPQK